MQGQDSILGFIGGSGLYDIPGVENGHWQRVQTPFGDPSDEIFTGELGGQKLAFLPRHGRGHVLSPTDINYRANIYALKSLGVTDLVSISACGSFREHMVPGDFVLVDQFIDRTFSRDKSFFGPGLVAHVALADPVCGDLLTQVAKAAKAEKISLHEAGTYLAMEGPQFSTRAESHLYRSWGCDVIGMTNMPEAKLAREAEICYCTVAMVTDFDCWHEDHDNVDVMSILQVLMGNAEKAKGLIAALAPIMADANRHPCVKGCDHALDTALITAPDRRDHALVKKLAPIMLRVLGK